MPGVAARHINRVGVPFLRHKPVLIPHPDRSRIVEEIILIRFDGLSCFIEYRNDRALPCSQIPSLQDQNPIEWLPCAITHSGWVFLLNTQHRDDVPVARNTHPTRQQAINRRCHRKESGNITIGFIDLNHSSNILRHVTARLGCIGLERRRPDALRILSIGDPNNVLPTLPNLTPSIGDFRRLNAPMRVDRVDPDPLAQSYDSNSPVREQEALILRDRRLFNIDLLRSLIGRHVFLIRRPKGETAFSPQESGKAVPLSLDTGRLPPPLRVQQHDPVVFRRVRKSRRELSLAQPHSDHRIPHTQLISPFLRHRPLRHATRQEHSSRQRGRDNSASTCAPRTQQETASSRLRLRRLRVGGVSVHHRFNLVYAAKGAATPTP